MTTLDRYLLLHFVKILGVAFLSLTGLYVIIDAFANLDEFLTFGEREGGMLRVLWLHYAPRALWFFDRTSGLLTLIAAMFVITSMQRTHELTAIQAAGVPKGRMARPLLYAVIVVSLLAAANRELLIPRFRDRLMRQAQDLSGQMARRVQARYDHRTNILLNGQESVAAERLIRRPVFRLPRTLSAYGRQLLAEQAFHRPASEHAPAGYLLVGVQQPATPADLPSVELDGRPAILSPKDTDWLQPNELFVVTDVGFEQLAAGNAFRQFSSLFELLAGLRNPSYDFGADVRVEIHARLLQPLLDVSLLLLGLPLVMGRENRNLFVASGLCVLVVAAYYLVLIASHALGSNQLLSPALAAWLPLFIFGPAAAAAVQPLLE